MTHENFYVGQYVVSIDVPLSRTKKPKKQLYRVEQLDVTLNTVRLLNLDTFKPVTTDDDNKALTQAIGSDLRRATRQYDIHVATDNRRARDAATKKQSDMFKEEKK